QKVKIGDTIRSNSIEKDEVNEKCNAWLHSCAFFQAMKTIRVLFRSIIVSTGTVIVQVDTAILAYRNLIHWSTWA
ncbi:hypothetical protein ACPV5V_33230, partial [Vibrio campbellii]